MSSVWTENNEIKSFDSLKEDIKTDVLIVGGGMAGLLCGYFIKQKGIDCVIAEAGKISQGITKNTTAKITSQHGLIYSDILKKYGKEKAKMYLTANETALRKYKKLCENIDCDFEEKSSFVYSLDDREKIEEEIRALEKLNYKSYFEKDLLLPFQVEGAVRFDKQYQFNPLKFIKSIISDLTIYENTFVKYIDNHKAVTDKGNIFAKKIIVATHFPFINKHGSYFIKMYQDRSYVIALENGPDVKGMYVDENDKGMSFRNYKNLLLVGGGSHRTGKKGEDWHELRKFAKRFYPDKKEVYHWATQDCITLDKIPYIGHYSKNTPDLYVASGFNKWGMTSSMVSAMILSDMVSGKTNRFQEVFSPHRNILKPQLFVNGFETMINMLTPIPKRCSHLGCALKWNKAEHTWDCSCHGSRFEKDGRLIDNPAKKNANIH